MKTITYTCDVCGKKSIDEKLTVEVVCYEHLTEKYKVKRVKDVCLKCLLEYGKNLQLYYFPEEPKFENEDKK